ncbi:MAG: sigma-70 family RNA polymerase sigma factor [Bryobacterales bacterium]|nr:sigma-70 family RNA polymerase sigma factor [Bryobacterales bacterium]
MSSAESGRVTTLLKAWANGSEAAREELIPLVYEELRRLARRHRRKVSAGETFKTTALVHEAYVRLVGIEGIEWQDRVHFFAVSAQLMRRILVDAVRARRAAKRGGGTRIIGTGILELDAIPAPDSGQGGEVLALDEALATLAELDPRRARIVELRVFGGLTVEETASATHHSPQTVMRDWKIAKAWLLRELGRRGSD